MSKSYDDYTKEEIAAIQKTVINNTLNKTNIDLNNININTLQQVTDKVLKHYDCQCDVCGSRIDEKEGVLQFERNIDKFPTKEDGLTLENITLVCLDCYTESEKEDATDSTSFSPSISSEAKKEVAQQVKTSSQNFEAFVANNTPSLFVKRNVSTFLYLLVFLNISIIGYGLFSGSITASYGLFGAIVGQVLYTIVYEYTFLFFIGLIPIVGLYTLLEYYQPPSYFLPDYKTGFVIGPITIPYIFHPILLAITTATWIVGGLAFTNDITLPLAEDTIILVLSISLICSLLLVVSLPRVFVKLVRSDKSTLLPRSVLSYAGAIAEKHGEVYIQDNKAKPAIKADYVREVFANEENLYGDYYYPVLWIFLVNLSVVYSFFAFLLTNSLYIGFEILFVSAPLLTVIAYIIYRFVIFKLVAKELKHKADEIKSELGLETGEIHREKESESGIEFKW